MKQAANLLQNAFATDVVSAASHCKACLASMASRRGLLLHARLSAIARQCELAHHRGAATLADTRPWIVASISHSTAHQALTIAASSFGAHEGSWTAGRGFAAHAETAVEPEANTVDLQFTNAAIEVGLTIASLPVHYSSRTCGCKTLNDIGRDILCGIAAMQRQSLLTRLLLSCSRRGLLSFVVHRCRGWASLQRRLLGSH